MKRDVGRLACHPLQIPLGLGIWALWFVALYGGTAVACAQQMPPSAISLGAGLFTALSAFIPATLALTCWRAARRRPARPPRERFIARVGAGTHAVAVVAMLFIALPLLGLPPCA